MGHPGGPGGRFFGPPPVVDHRRHHQRRKSKHRPSRITSVTCIVSSEGCEGRVVHLKRLLYYIRRKRWHTDIHRTPCVNEFGLGWLRVLNNLGRRNYCQYGVFWIMTGIQRQAVNFMRGHLSFFFFFLKKFLN